MGGTPGGACINAFSPIVATHLDLLQEALRQGCDRARLGHVARRDGCECPSSSLNKGEERLRVDGKEEWARRGDERSVLARGSGDATDGTRANALTDSATSSGAAARSIFLFGSRSK